VLDGLIEQRLRLHEIGRYGFEETPLEEVDRQVEALAARFPDEPPSRRARAPGPGRERPAPGRGAPALGARLRRAAAGAARVRRRRGDPPLLRRGARPELARDGQPPPPIDQVRRADRALLRERRLNEEIDR